MEKKILMFFAALAAIIVTLGFTACSDDDEDDYTAVYTITLSSEQDDNDDLQTAISAFAAAFNTDVTQKTFTVKVKGSSSTSCQVKLQAMILVAETVLNKKTSWEAPVSIVITDSEGTTVYQKTYGGSSSNAVV